MKTVNLEEILNTELRKGGFSLDLISRPETLQAMREACNQAIDLCIENTHPSIYYDEDDDTYNCDVLREKELILKTKEQII